MFRFTMSSLHIRLAVIILLVMAPALGLTFYSGLKQREQAEILVKDNALRMTSVMTIYQEELILRTHQMLLELADDPSVRTYDTATCNTVFSAIQKQYPVYTDLMAAKPNGDVFCTSSSDLPSTSINVADLDWFKRSIQIRDFAVSDVINSRVSGRTIFTFGYPIFDEKGSLQAVVGAGLGLEVLNSFTSRAQLPTGSTVTLIDGSGTVLARYPELSAGVGQTDTPLINTVLAQHGTGTAELPGVDGVDRLYAFTYIRYSEQGLYLTVGIPTSVAYGEIDRLMTWNLSLLGFITLAELVIAIMGGVLFILRPIRKMVDVTQKLSAGDFSTRIDMTRIVGELKPLLQALNDMAARLEKHEGELREAETRYRTLVEKIPTVIYTVNLDDAQLHYISPRVETLLGYTHEELLANPKIWSLCIIPDDIPLVQNAIARCKADNAPIHLEYRMRTRDGRIIWVRDDANPLRDEAGTAQLLQGTLLDITDHKQASDIIEAQQQALRELSTPLLAIGDNMILMPLIGAMDSLRAGQMMEFLLKGVQQRRAKIVILDITGVSLVDTQVSNAIIQTERAIRLLGARVILTGIRPEVAQALVGLGVDLSSIVTYSTLQNGIQDILKRHASSR